MQVVSLNAPAELKHFKPELFVSELQVFTQRMLLGIGLIEPESNRGLILTHWKKGLASVIELLEAHSFTSKEDLLRKFHIRVKIDIRKTLTALRDYV